MSKEKYNKQFIKRYIDANFREVKIHFKIDVDKQAKRVKQ